jgi:hypothetical protein
MGVILVTRRAGSRAAAMIMMVTEDGGPDGDGVERA